MTNSIQPINWPDAAYALSAHMNEQPLQDAVCELFAGDSCERVLVACSGGADSVFLLCQLWTQAPQLGIELVVGHYNHRWRGADSELDAQFVEVLAQQLGCQYVTAARPEHEAAFTETTARALRLDFLRAAAQAHNCQCIALGHQLDDILETQLQRLVRGSGADGLAAPRPIHFFEYYPTHVRPVLHMRAGAIRMALNACEIPWREDISNEDVRISRNALRHTVIPELGAALGRDVAEGSARSRRLLEEDANALDALARVLIPDAFTGGSSLPRGALRLAPRALTRRALSAWLGDHDLIQSVSAPAMDLLLDAVYAKKAVNRLSAGAFYIVLDEAQVQLELAQADDASLNTCLVEIGESVILSSGASFSIEAVELNDDLRRRIMTGAVDECCEAYIVNESGLGFHVRGWQPGDRFRPIGAPGMKKLKDWFIDRKIAVKERKLLPLVLSNSAEIIWVPGFPPANTLKISASTKEALRLTYEQREPT